MCFGETLDAFQWGLEVEGFQGLTRGGKLEQAGGVAGEEVHFSCFVLDVLIERNGECVKGKELMKGGPIEGEGKGMRGQDYQSLFGRKVITKQVQQSFNFF